MKTDLQNRELQIMTFISHPNVVDLRAFFYSSADKVYSSLSGLLRECLELIVQKEEVYLNLVLEYMPETVYCASRRHSTSNQIMPMLQIKLYMYQVSQMLLFHVKSGARTLCSVERFQLSMCSDGVRRKVRN